MLLITRAATVRGSLLLDRAGERHRRWDHQPTDVPRDRGRIEYPPGDGEPWPSRPESHGKEAPCRERRSATIRIFWASSRDLHGEDECGAADEAITDEVST